MRSEAEIQRAHDILLGFILDDVPAILSPKVKTSMRCAADVLCWALEHDHNQAFEKNLAELATTAERFGFVLKERKESTPDCGYDEASGRDVPV